MPHAYTPTLTVAARCPRHQWQRMCTTHDSGLPKWKNHNRRETKSSGLSMCVRVDSWANRVFVICCYCSLPHIGLASRVRARPFTPHSVFVVFMALICEQQLHLLLTQAGTYSVCTVHTQVCPKKREFIRHMNTHKNTTNAICIVYVTT